MDAEEHRRRSSSFGGVAQAYAENRPDYPTEAAAWLVGEQPTRVLELGSGTGKLTRTLVSLGHDVIATDPLPAMLSELTKVAPSARPIGGRAEQIPLTSSAVNVVVCAQAFHWFDPERALPEIARVLRAGGVLAMVWNTGDFKVPWVRKVLGLIAMTEDANEDPLAGSGLFTTRESRIFRHWQRFRRDTLIGFISSSSYAAVLAPPEREALLAEVGAIYDSYDRGPHGMLMPWQARCFRATVTGLSTAGRDSSPPADDGLLIDFA